MGVGDGFGAEVMRMNGGGGTGSCGTALCVQAWKAAAEMKTSNRMVYRWNDFMLVSEKDNTGDSHFSQATVTCKTFWFGISNTLSGRRSDG